MYKPLRFDKKEGKTKVKKNFLFGLLVVGLVMMFALALPTGNLASSQNSPTCNYSTFSKECIGNNGTKSLEVFGDKFYDGNQLINLSREIINATNSTNFDYKSEAVPYDAFFANDINTGKANKFVYDDFNVSYDLSGGKMQWSDGAGKTKSIGSIQSSIGSVSNNTITYQDAFQNTDVEYVLEKEQQKENFILNSLPKYGGQKYLEYIGTLRYSDNLEIWANGQNQTKKSFNTSGRINLKDSNGTTQLYMPAPIASDANGTQKSLNYDVKPNSGKLTFKVQVNASWLNNSNTIYPVKIDPSLAVDGTTTTLGGYNEYTYVEVINNGEIEVNDSDGWLTLNATENISVDQSSLIDGEGKRNSTVVDGANITLDSQKLKINGDVTVDGGPSGSKGNAGNLTIMTNSLNLTDGSLFARGEDTGGDSPGGHGGMINLSFDKTNSTNYTISARGGDAGDGANSELKPGGDARFGVYISGSEANSTNFQINNKGGEGGDADTDYSSGAGGNASFIKIDLKSFKINNSEIISRGGDSGSSNEGTGQTGGHFGSEINITANYINFSNSNITTRAGDKNDVGGNTLCQAITPIPGADAGDINIFVSNSQKSEIKDISNLDLSGGESADCQLFSYEDGGDGGTFNLKGNLRIFDSTIDLLAGGEKDGIGGNFKYSDSSLEINNSNILQRGSNYENPSNDRLSGIFNISNSSLVQINHSTIDISGPDAYTSGDRGADAGYFNIESEKISLKSSNIKCSGGTGKSPSGMGGSASGKNNLNSTLKTAITSTSISCTGGAGSNGSYDNSELGGEGGQGGFLSIDSKPLDITSSNLRTSGGRGGDGSDGGFSDCRAGGSGGNAGNISLFDTEINLSNSDIRSKGGRGGDGGSERESGNDGCNGGNGGNGGNVSIAYTSSVQNSTTTFNVSGGDGGQGGNGGDSFDNDGSDGINGSDGIVNYTQLISAPQLQNPAAGLTTSQLTHDFVANISQNDSGFEIENMTLRIYNSSSLEFSKTVQNPNPGTKNMTLNETYILKSFDDYQWYVSATNNDSTTLSSENRSLTTRTDYTKKFPNAIGFTKSRLAENSKAKMRFDKAGQNNQMQFCNFTIKDPQGTTIVNNQNGTRVSDTLWNSSEFLIDRVGDYPTNVTCEDEYGKQYKAKKNLTASHQVFYNPKDFEFGAKEEENETNNFLISSYDDSQGEINYSISTAIENPSNFTQAGTDVSSILLNQSDNQSNQRIVNYTIQAKDGVNGTFDGTVSFSNTTYNSSFTVDFTYGINPPSGFPRIYSESGTQCTDDPLSVCANDLDTTEGDVKKLKFQAQNDGFHEISGCNVEYTDDFADVSWLTVNKKDFSLEINETINYTVKLDTENTPKGDFRGYQKISCDSSNLLDDPVDSPSDNTPFLRLDHSFQTGGAGSSGGAVPGVDISENKSWEVTTSGGSKNYVISGEEGITIDDRPLIFTNTGGETRTITLTCENVANEACRFVSFSDQTFDLEPSQEFSEEIGVTINLPEDPQDNYQFNLVAKDEIGRTDAVGYRVNIGGFVTSLSGKLVGGLQTTVFGLTISYSALYFIMLGAIWGLIAVFGVLIDRNLGIVGFVSGAAIPLVLFGIGLV